MMTDDERVRILSEAKPNTWLALSSDETKIVGRGDSYSEAVEDALNHGESDPLLIKVPDNWEPRVFFAHKLQILSIPQSATLNIPLQISDLDDEGIAFFGDQLFLAQNWNIPGTCFDCGRNACCANVAL